MYPKTLQYIRTKGPTGASKITQENYHTEDTIMGKKVTIFFSGRW